MTASVLRRRAEARKSPSSGQKTFIDARLRPQPLCLPPRTAVGSFVVMNCVRSGGSATAVASMLTRPLSLRAGVKGPARGHRWGYRAGQALGEASCELQRQGPPQEAACPQGRYSPGGHCALLAAMAPPAEPPEPRRGRHRMQPN